MGSPRVNDVGTLIAIGFPDEDLSAVQDAKIIMRKPGGVAEEIKDGAIVDGEVHCYIGETDFDRPGVYQFQAFVEFADWSGYSTIKEVTVEGNLAVVSE